MPAKHIPGKKRIPFDVAGNGTGFFCGIGPVGADMLGGLKQLGRDNLQMGQRLGTAFATAENTCISEVTDNSPNGGVVPFLARPRPVAKLI